MEYILLTINRVNEKLRYHCLVSLRRTSVQARKTRTRGTCNFQGPYFPTNSPIVGPGKTFQRSCCRVAFYTLFATFFFLA